MKITIKLLLIIILLVSCSNDEDDLFATIPDANFEQALIDLGFDTDGVVNGTVSKTDIAEITELHLDQKKY